LYCGRFSSNGKYVLAGGAYSNEARILTVNGKLIYRIYDLSKAVTTCDWNGDSSQFAIAGGDGYVRLFDVNSLPDIDYGS
jgi:WD40 repeat protein